MAMKDRKCCSELEADEPEAVVELDIFNSVTVLESYNVTVTLGDSD